MNEALNREVERCREEQRLALAHMAIDPKGGRIWLNDWFAEEFLLVYGA